MICEFGSALSEERGERRITHACTTRRQAQRTRRRPGAPDALLVHLWPLETRPGPRSYFSISFFFYYVGSSTSAKQYNTQPRARVTALRPTLAGKVGRCSPRHGALQGSHQRAAGGIRRQASRDRVHRRPHPHWVGRLFEQRPGLTCAAANRTGIG